jgi:hypothetical protein
MMNPRGFALLELIIILAVAATLAGGGWYFTHPHNEQVSRDAGISAEQQARQGIQQSNQQTQQEQNALNQIDLTANATANWETYTNQQYGFAMKYPPEFVDFKEDVGDGNGDGSYDPGCGDTPADVFFEAQGGPGFSLALLRYQSSVREMGMFTGGSVTVNLSALKQGISSGKIDWAAVDPMDVNNQGEIKSVGVYDVHESSSSGGNACAGATDEIQLFTPKYFVTLSISSGTPSLPTSTFNLLENIATNLNFY